MAQDSDRFGALVDPASLAADKARALAAFLLARDDVGCRLVESRQAADRSWVIVEIDVDVGQLPVADIRRTEQLAVGFELDDRDWPKVRALRPDFPQPLPHQFLTPPGDLAALCLSEAPWEDAKRRWSSGRFVRLLRTWLIDTARGALHREEQVLEPFLAGSSARLILPADLFEALAAGGRTLFGQALNGSDQTNAPIYRLSFALDPGQPAAKLVAAAISTPPREHAAIQRTPRTLAELRAILQTHDFDFSEALDQLVSAWLDTPSNLDAIAVLLVHVPTARHRDGDVERHELWAFFLGENVRQLAVALDLWSEGGEGGSGRVLAFQRKASLEDDQVQIDVLNPVFELSPASAAAFNGYGAPSGLKLAAVGAGALGSQILSNLLRAGESLSAVADCDRFLPHNGARHAAWDSQLVGQPKASIMRLMAERRFPGSVVPATFVVDAADPDGGMVEAYRAALASADIILDFAAAVPVSRRLCLDEPGDARRMSAFLSPTGRDLVVLAEDRARRVPLDHLELNYYRDIAEDSRLAGHFDLPPQTRYARSCREVSAQLPQSHVGLHAGIAAGVIRNLLESDGALAAVWRLDPDSHEVTRVELDVRPMRTFSVGGWTVLVSEPLIETLYAKRSARLPAETGGVLLGDFDTSRRRVYLTSAIDSPRDSRESTTSYIRGSFGLQDAVSDVERRTLSMLQYVGEWHSHPAGSPATPSEDDLALYAHLSAEMTVDGYPPVMLIASENHFGLLVDNALALSPIGAEA